MRHWWTTENSNMAVKTGRTYISDNMTDIVKIPTANLRNLGSSTTASSESVPSSNDRQRKSLRKPEILISLHYERRHWNSNGKSGIYDRRARKSVGDWYQQRATTGNSHMTVKTRNTYIAGIMIDSVEIPTPNPGLSTMESSVKVSPSDCDNDR